MNDVGRSFIAPPAIWLVGSFQATGQRGTQIRAERLIAPYAAPEPNRRSSFRSSRPAQREAQTRQTRFFLAFPDMLFDQGGACGKDRGKGEKETANYRAKAGRDEACGYGHRAAQHESDEILVPTRLTKGGRLELDDQNAASHAAFWSRQRDAKRLNTCSPVLAMSLSVSCACAAPASASAAMAAGRRRFGHLTSSVPSASSSVGASQP